MNQATDTRVATPNIMRGIARYLMQSEVVSRAELSASNLLSTTNETINADEASHAVMRMVFAMEELLNASTELMNALRAAPKVSDGPAKPKTDEEVIRRLEQIFGANFTVHELTKEEFESATTNTSEESASDSDSDSDSDCVIIGEQDLEIVGTRSFLESDSV